MSTQYQPKIPDLPANVIADIKSVNDDLTIWQHIDQYGITLPDNIANACEKRQREFILGRYCALESLHKLCGTNTPPGCTERGLPLWPLGTCGSISHSREFAAAMVAKTEDYLSLGLDIEAVVSVSSAERIQHRILNPSEINWQDDKFSVEEFTTLVFSLKETLYKALYPLVNKTFYFSAASLVELTEDRAVMKLNETLTEHWPEGEEFECIYTSTAHWITTVLMIPQS